MRWLALLVLVGCGEPTQDYWMTWCAESATGTGVGVGGSSGPVVVITSTCIRHDSLFVAADDSATAAQKLAVWKAMHKHNLQIQKAQR